MTPNDFVAQGWKIKGDMIEAPCGCAGWVSDVPEQKLFFYDFVSCKLIQGCVFRAKTRALTFHKEIPTDEEVWYWYNHPTLFEARA